MTKKILMPTILLLLVCLPFAVSRRTAEYYDHYEAIALKYECYPIATCRADFNGDGRPDRIVVADDRAARNEPAKRLKIFVEEQSGPREILDIAFEQIDNTYRTHTAFVEHFGKKKLIIYDTINRDQFFVWDGRRLVPDADQPELDAVGGDGSASAREIRQAMALEDDTGGFDAKIMFRASDYGLFAIYYLLLAAGVGIYFYCARKLKMK